MGFSYGKNLIYGEVMLQTVTKRNPLTTGWVRRINEKLNEDSDLNIQDNSKTKRIRISGIVPTRSNYKKVCSPGTIGMIIGGSHYDAEEHFGVLVTAISVSAYTGIRIQVATLDTDSKRNLNSEEFNSDLLDLELSDLIMFGLPTKSKLKTLSEISEAYVQGEDAYNWDSNFSKELGKTNLDYTYYLTLEYDKGFEELIVVAGCRRYSLYKLVRLFNQINLGYVIPEDHLDLTPNKDYNVAKVSWDSTGMGFGVKGTLTLRTLKKWINKIRDAISDIGTTLIIPETVTNEIYYFYNKDTQKEVGEPLEFYSEE